MIFRLLRIYGLFRVFFALFPEHEVLHIDNVCFSETEPFLLDQPDSFLCIQLRQEFYCGLPAASHHLSGIFDCKSDIHPSLIVEPLVLHGQGHPVQQKTIEDLRFTGELFKVWVSK